MHMDVVYCGNDEGAGDMTWGALKRSPRLGLYPSCHSYHLQLDMKLHRGRQRDRTGEMMCGEKAENKKDFD